MTDQQQVLKNIVEHAICDFNQAEAYLLDKNLSERCICSKFAEHLNKTVKLKGDYSDYIVDVEYNRGNEGSERSAKRLHNKLIVVDLILHKRGYDNDYGFDNLICIEIKKSNDSRGKRGIDSDTQRLKDLVSDEYGFNYKIGFMVIANMKSKELEIMEFFIQ